MSINQYHPWVLDKKCSSLFLFLWYSTHHPSVSNIGLTPFATGNSVQVYGTIGPSSSDGIPQTTYILDSMPPVIYIAANNPGVAIYRQPFYTSPNISNNDHNLTVTMNGGGTLWLDYFLFTQTTDDTSAAPLKGMKQLTTTGLPSGSATSTADVSSTSQFPSTASTAAVDTSIPVVTSVPISSSSTTLPGVNPSTGTSPVAILPTSVGSIHAAPFPIATLVEAVIGTLVGLALLGFTLWYLIRRRRRRTPIIETYTEQQEGTARYPRHR